MDRISGMATDQGVERPYDSADDLCASHKSLEHTTRLRNLLDISILLTSFESREETTPAFMEGLAQTLSLRSVIVLLQSDEVYTWRQDGLTDDEMAKDYATAETVYQFFTRPFSGVEPDVYSHGAKNPARIALPIATKDRPAIGIIQIIGYDLDEADLLYLNVAAHQFSLAVLRDIGIRRKQALSAEKVDAAEKEKDVAELARDEAQRAKQMQEDLLSVVSHDLRNPLTAILIGSDYLLDVTEVDERQRTTIQSIRTSAERMRRLVSDLADWAKISLGRVSVTVAPVKVAELFDDAKTMMGPIAAAKQIRFDEVELADPSAAVRCDRDRVNQVFSNLLGNAVKFSHVGGTIHLCAEVASDEVVFSVSDEGRGIGQEAVEHIFERFWQENTGDKQGSGLGLAITRGLVEAQGGRIWAESEIGQGATVSFTLPRA